MKQLYKATPKEYISKLPQATFKGRIYTISNLADAQKAVQVLKSQSLLGIDTETRPAFKKGVVHKVSLLQISTNDVCFLFRLNLIGLPSELVSIFEDENIVKVGLSLKDDIVGLQKRANFKPQNFVDIQSLVRQLGIEDMSLQKIYANFFGFRISKGARLTNWDNELLTDSQKQYAALDAYACLELYVEIKKLVRVKRFEIVAVPVLDSNDKDLTNN